MIRALPLFVGLSPVLGITAAYWLNVDAGTLPSCMPFLDGCTSISATGRYLPGSLVFRAVLLPQAALLVVLWWISTGWLKSLSHGAKGRKSILIFGAVGAVALIIYVSFLGTTQVFYEFMRRFGIYFYFLGTALAQFILTWSMPTSRLRSVMLVVVGTPFILGVINLLQKTILADPNNIENSIEWIAAFLMQVWFVLLYFAWRTSVITIAVQTDPTNDRH
jgi:hypothetical protein